MQLRLFRKLPKQRKPETNEFLEKYAEDMETAARILRSMAPRDFIVLVSDILLTRQYNEKDVERLDKLANDLSRFVWSKKLP